MSSGLKIQTQVSDVKSHASARPRGNERGLSGVSACKPLKEDRDASHGQPTAPESQPVRRPAWLSFANVAAALALFFALTGTAAAAVTLARDSVGAEHIQADAVRSSEIQADAVRSPEILDESIVLADLAPGARTALDAPRVRVDDDADGLQSLPDARLLDCSNLMAIHLPAGRWLVHAKLALLGLLRGHRQDCGLLQSDTTIIDTAPFIGRVRRTPRPASWSR